MERKKDEIFCLGNPAREGFYPKFIRSKIGLHAAGYDTG